MPIFISEYDSRLPLPPSPSQSCRSRRSPHRHSPHSFPSVPTPEYEGGLESPCHTPLAKYEHLCYSIPMKWAAGPLLLLGACRIHTALEAKHRASPCGRRAEGTTQGARPSEEGWDRSQCRYKAQALWSHPAPLRFRYGAITDPLRIPFRSFTTPLQLLYGLLRPCTGSVPTPAKIRRISITMPRSPSGSLPRSRIEVLWTTASVLSAVAFGAPPASRPLCG